MKTSEVENFRNELADTRWARSEDLEAWREAGKAKGRGVRQLGESGK